ncbi:hypothetical protein [Paenibacillus sp. 32352]|uniref:hypothetical protein n=1 Tax=Paenibacillus sp. 32352 TaxID=1969111 RepID=UPI0009ACF738|nr:hypothetical protein [Paenibacillus sp. 32352]
MLFTVLARLHDVETEYWYSKAKDWATASGISDGGTPEASISREQLITIPHRYAGLPAASNNSKSFADSGEVSAMIVRFIAWRSN